MTGPYILRIPARLHDDLVRHARSELPNECVGLLAGDRDGRVRARYPLVNELQSPTRFLSEPRSMLRAEKQRRAAGLEVLAVYHSHPTSPPVPSRHDLRDHYSSDVMCVIISLAQAEPTLRGWWLTGEQFNEGELLVEGAEAAGSEVPPTG